MAQPAETTEPGGPARKGLGPDLFPLVACSLIWGTTWFAITKQLGVVPAVVSIAYRFGLAALLLFAWRLIRRQPIRLNRDQHIAVFLQGFFTFGINYSFVYFAEERVASAVVAVIFASLTFTNLVLFRLFLGQKGARGAWMGGALGVVGVAVLSFAELQRAHMDAVAWAGLGCGLIGVLGAAVGNLFAHRAQKAGVDVGAATAWGMAYGAGVLALWALVTGQSWSFPLTADYVGSLLYLSLFGSVAAFVLYFGLARRRGYSFASYISAITPPIAMLVSAVFEHAHWGMEAFFGIALVVTGQVLLIRAPRGA